MLTGNTAPGAESITRELVWRAERWPGLEHTALRVTEHGVSVDGALVAVEHEQPLRVRYQLECDSSWRPLRVMVDVFGQRTLSLVRDENRWFDGDGKERPDLSGCLDVDIALTPFTNTIPIRRLALDPGQSADLDVVYVVPGPAVETRPQRQRYIRIDDGFRYESGSFQADLRVDTDGIVTEYPGLWTLISG